MPDTDKHMRALPPADGAARGHSNRLAPASIEDLVELARLGDAAAFSVLIERFTPMMMGFLLGIMGQAGDREDVVQEAFCSAYEGLHSLRAPSQFGPWVLRIAKHKAADYHRRQSILEKYTRRELKLMERESTPCRSIPTPLEEASQNEVEEAVLHAISELRPRYRTIVYMRLIGDLAPTEIAQLSGLKPGTVRVRLMRGLRLLREKLEEWDPR